MFAFHRNKITLFFSSFVSLLLHLWNSNSIDGNMFEMTLAIIFFCVLDFFLKRKLILSSTITDTTTATTIISAWELNWITSIVMSVTLARKHFCHVFAVCVCVCVLHCFRIYWQNFCLFYSHSLSLPRLIRTITFYRLKGSIFFVENKKNLCNTFYFNRLTGGWERNKSENKCT